MEQQKVIQVGQVFPGNMHIALRVEAVEYSYRNGIHQLLLVFPGLRPHEVQAVKRGAGTLGLYVNGEVIQLIFKLEGQRLNEGITWSDAPYNWHMEREPRTVPPDPETFEEGQGAALNIILLAAETHVVQAIRVIGLSTFFTRKLHAAIIEQSNKPFDQVIYDRKLRMIQATYDAKQMYKQAIARYEFGAVR